MLTSANEVFVNDAVASTAGAATVVHLGGFLLIVGHVSPVFLAAGLSFAAAAANYALSALFASHATPSWRRFGHFLAFALLGLGMNAGVTAFIAAAGAALALAKLESVGNFVWGPCGWKQRRHRMARRKTPVIADQLLDQLLGAADANPRKPAQIAPPGGRWGAGEITSV